MNKTAHVRTHSLSAVNKKNRRKCPRCGVEITPQDVCPDCGARHDRGEGNLCDDCQAEEAERDQAEDDDELRSDEITF